MDGDIKEYVDKYCGSYRHSHKTPEMAMQEALVKEVDEYYKEVDKGVLKCEP